MLIWTLFFLFDFYMLILQICIVNMLINLFFFFFCNLKIMKTILKKN